MNESLAVRKLRTSTNVESLAHLPPAIREPSRGPQSVRVFDLVVAIAAIVFTAPLLIAIAVAIRLSDGGPALFRQERIGRDGRRFQCLKFRTMVVDSEQRLAAVLASNPIALSEWERYRKLRDDPRITAVGRFLRKSSLDELPQVFNVLKGEMSIVGPRPITASEIRLYGFRFADYARCKPGITGLWQVSGRSDTNFRRRVALDTVYSRRRTLWLDLKLIALTIPAVLSGRGSY